MGKGTGEINGHEMHIQYKAAAACEKEGLKTAIKVLPPIRPILNVFSPLSFISPFVQAI